MALFTKYFINMYIVKYENELKRSSRVIILFKWSKGMEELIKFLGGAPKSCADCSNSEWVNDPYATGDSPGGWECSSYSCEFSERITDFCSEYDKIESTISKKEDAGEDCSDLYQLLDSADEILNYGFGWA